MRSCVSDGLTDAVRRFQWFYTRHVWAPYELAEQSALSPTEWRVLFAIMHAGTTIAAELSRTLQINTGYLSRMLNEFERNGLIERNPYARDARSNQVSLTPAGEKSLAATSTSVRENVSTALKAMTPAEGSQLMASMETVERLLTLSPNGSRVRLRGPRPGDFGWIVEYEAQLTAGGDSARRASEIRAARVVAEYLTAPDPTRNACWIAEKDGTSAGAGLLVCTPGSRDARIAVLFVVDPDTGHDATAEQLIKACEEFAVESGYERLSCVSDLRHELFQPLLYRCGFQRRRNDETIWEKFLK
jgi:DNA-binding MarR family transcriptional regulator